MIPWPNDMVTLALTALGLTAFFFMITHRRKALPDHELEVRRSVQRLFELAVRKDYQAAASLLAAGEDDILRYSQQPELVEQRCQELQEMASQGGVSIDRVVRQSDQDHPDYLCEISLVGARRTALQQIWRWTRGRYALLAGPG